MVKGSGISAHHLREAVGRSRPTQNRAKRYTYFSRNESWSRLSHLYREFCVHCIVIMNDGGMG